MFISIKEWVGVLCGIIGASISTLLGANMNIVMVLISFMVLDYITGIIVAGVFKKSGKSETGAIDSHASLKGLFRKGGMLFVIYIALQIDVVLGFSYVGLATIYFFLANETISLIENIGLMGVPMPSVLVDAIEVLKKKSEETEDM